MYRLTDHFCGMGGSSAGAVSVPGVKLTAAANHWQLALDVHEENHPDAMHTRADLSRISPAYFPYTELAWFSPSCPGHSQARGVERDHMEDSLWGESLPTEAAARSRATMWDVVRFAGHHRYLAVVVENVIEVAKWGPKEQPGLIFGNWLTSMVNLGYDYEIVCFNAMHAQAEGLPAPQSRDRIFIVFWLKGNRRPDLDAVRSPGAWCGDCERVVRAVQWWKKPGNKVGRYRQQYLYKCVTCAGVVEPYWLAAETIIDWSLRGQRIGDRARPLAVKTRARIAAGIARYWLPLIVEAAGSTYDSTDPRHVRYGDPNGYVRAWPTSQPIKTIHTTVSKALVVPVEGRDGKDARPVEVPLRTQTSRNESGLAFMVTEKGTSEAHIRASAYPAEHPLRTVAASGNHHGLVTPYYGTSEGAKPTDEPLGTITATDRWALVMRNNGGGAEMSTPVTEPLRTITTAGHQSVLTADDIAKAAEYVDEVRFRMLEPIECKRAQAFDADYKMQGTKRQQVRLAGNAVPPPMARDLVACVVRSLEGAA